MKKYLFVVLTLSVVSISCKKYDDGPALSLRSKKERVCKAWIALYYSEDGVDKTTDWMNTFQSASIKLSKGGDYLTSYKYLGLYDYTEDGTWSFNADKKFLLFTRVDPTPNSWDWRVIRLTKNEFWIEDYTSAGIRQVLKMIPK